MTAAFYSAVIDDLRAHARHLERYPFESAAMAEAALIAANNLREVADELEDDAAALTTPTSNGGQ